MDINEIRSKMNKSIDFLISELKKLRTSKASASLVEDIRVNVYESHMPISQLATIIIPESNVILIQPWDKNNVSAIKDAILNVNIGITPIENDDSVRLVLPPLSEERRNDFVKILNNKVESAKVSLRSIRKEYIDGLKKDKEENNISEDEYNRDVEHVDSLIKEMNIEIEKIFEDKKKDLLEI